MNNSYLNEKSSHNNKSVSLSCNAYSDGTKREQDDYSVGYESRQVSPPPNGYRIGEHSSQYGGSSSSSSRNSYSSQVHYSSNGNDSTSSISSLQELLPGRSSKVVNTLSQVGNIIRDAYQENNKSVDSNSSSGTSTSNTVRQIRNVVVKSVSDSREERRQLREMKDIYREERKQLKHQARDEKKELRHTFREQKRLDKKMEKLEKEQAKVARKVLERQQKIDRKAAERQLKIDRKAGKLYQGISQDVYLGGASRDQNSRLQAQFTEFPTSETLPNYGQHTNTNRLNENDYRKYKIEESHTTGNISIDNDSPPPYSKEW